MERSRSVLHLMAGSPSAPSSGLDVVVAEHMAELTLLPGVTVTGLCAVPGTPGGKGGAQDASQLNFASFAGDIQTETHWTSRVLNKFWYIMTGGILANYSYKSKHLQSRIRQELNQKYDLVVVEHAATLANISLPKLPFRRTIFIAHDATHHSLVDSGRLKGGWLRRLFYGVQSVQAYLIEAYITKMAVKTIFLSDWDRRAFSWLNADSIALCPSLPGLGPDEEPWYGRAQIEEIVFIGSPAFAPNRFALEWIVKELAPELWTLDPKISIRLIGKGTEEFAAAAPVNVKASGFVSADDLKNALRNSIGLISPVIHGSGIKIKVLEAIAVGCPVFATAESLRGFEFMAIKPSVFVKDPTATARTIVQFAGDAIAQGEMRRDIRSAWAAHVSVRTGALNRIILGILESSAKSSGVGIF